MKNNKVDWGFVNVNDCWDQIFLMENKVSYEDSEILLNSTKDIADKIFKKRGLNVTVHWIFYESHFDDDKDSFYALTCNILPLDIDVDKENKHEVWNAALLTIESHLHDFKPTLLNYHGKIRAYYRFDFSSGSYGDDYEPENKESKEYFYNLEAACEQYFKQLPLKLRKINLINDCDSDCPETIDCIN